MRHRCQPADLTYTARYVACSRCHQRWEWHGVPDGWVSNPRLGPARWGR